MGDDSVPSVPIRAVSQLRLMELNSALKGTVLRERSRLKKGGDEGIASCKRRMLETKAVKAYKI